MQVSINNPLLLFHAIRDNNIDYFQKNIRPVDLNMKDITGLTMLELAEKLEKIEIVNFLKNLNLNLQDNKVNISIIFKAIRNSDDNYLNNNLHKVVDLNVKDQDGRTMLHLAIKHKRKDIAIYLIGKGANLNLQDNKGKTPLVLAWRYNWDVDFLKYLNDKGAGIDIKYKTKHRDRECTFVDRIFSDKNTEFLEFLLSKGYELKKLTDHDLFYLAYNANRVDLMSLFLKKGQYNEDEKKKK